MGGDKPKREDSDQELHTTFKRLRVDPDRYGTNKKLYLHVCCKMTVSKLQGLMITQFNARCSVF